MKLSLPELTAARVGRWRIPLALATGAALNLAFAPFQIWSLAIVAPAILFALIDGVSARRAAVIGAAFGAGFFTCGTYWLYTSIHGFGQVPVWLTLLLQTALVALMASYPAVLGFLANRFWNSAGSIRAWLVLPSLWVLLEWLRGWLFSGFPWLSLGYAFIDSPLAGLAPIFGIYGVTAAAVLAASALRFLVARQTTRAQHYAAAVVLLGIFVVPIALARITWTQPSGAPISVAIAQGAVPQDLKWQENNHAATLEKYTRLTRSALGTRLIVWPEAALPILANDLGEYLDMMKTEARARRSDLIMGLLRYDPNTDRYHNGVLVMSNADGWYYKRHLVPFGEYFPVPAFVRSWMRLMSLPFTDMSPGERDQPILLAAGQPLGLTICYEDAYGSEQLAVLKSATLLVNVTNNAWYGDSTAPHQHLEISRFRALEAGRYLIRAANDGISAVIGPDGKVTAQVPQFKEALLRSEVVPRAGLTPYARVGNYPVIGLALLALGWAGWRVRRGA